MTDRCCVNVPSPGMWSRTRQCTRIGRYEVDGQKYCHQHNPAEVQKRRDERQTDYDRADKQRRLNHTAPALLKSLTDMVEFYDSDGLEIGPSEEARKLIESLK